jgi:hypothetical protein
MVPKRKSYFKYLTKGANVTIPKTTLWRMKVGYINISYDMKIPELIDSCV